jgi:hypothetical protein
MAQAVESNKARNLLRTLRPGWFWEGSRGGIKAQDIARHVLAVARLCKLTLTDPGDTEALAGMLDHFGFDPPARRRTEAGQVLEELAGCGITFAIKDGVLDMAQASSPEKPYRPPPTALVKRAKSLADDIVAARFGEAAAIGGVVGELLARCREETRLVDFEDMLWLPVVHGLRPEQATLLLGDESQDWSRVQQALAMSALADGGRIAILGDVHQAIYSWIGADSQSMPRMAAGLAATRQGCRSFPLTITWRCPASHVALANAIVPGLRARPDAPAGTILEEEEVYVMNAQPGDMVISRRYAPLVKLAMFLAGRGIPVAVRGRDGLSRGLLDVIDRLRPDSIFDFLSKLDAWHDAETSRLEKAQASEGLFEQVDDTRLCLREMASLADTVGELKEHIRKVFSDDDTGDEGKVVLSSIHRCVHPDTLVETQGGVMRIADIPDEGRIAAPDGVRLYSGKFSRPEGTALWITTHSGYSIIATPEHGFTAWIDGHRRVEARHLDKGNLLRLRLGTTIDPAGPPLVPAAPEKDCRATSHNVPASLTEELAEFLGLMVADGTVYKAGFRIVKRHESVIQRAAQLGMHLFGTPGRIKDHDGTPCWEINSTFLAAWLLRFDGLQPNAKGIPREILAAPLAMQAAFLRGLFEDGTVNVKGSHVDHIHFENRDASVARTVQTMLLRFGIISAMRERMARESFRISTVYIYGQNARRFSEKIGFIAAEKNRRLAEGTFAAETHYSIPLTAEEARLLRPWMSKHEADNALARLKISRNTARLLLERSQAGLPVNIRERLGWHYEAIRSIWSTTCPSMCVTVPDGERFLQNGFDGWNSKGLEARRVFVADTGCLPLVRACRGCMGKGCEACRFAGTRARPWEIQAEMNLIYIAATRAKDTLVFLGGIPAILGGGF